MQVRADAHDKRNLPERQETPEHRRKPSAHKHPSISVYQRGEYQRTNKNTGTRCVTEEGEAKPATLPHLAFAQKEKHASHVDVEFD